MLQAIDARSARRWAMGVRAALAEARHDLDEINVFPVADRDTGTNLYLTVDAAVRAITKLPRKAMPKQVLEAFANGALIGARGNSGIITAQLLRGWADVLAERDVLDGPAVKEAVRRADEQAWRAVAEPIEGTILSVSRAGARAVAHAGESLPEVVAALVTATREALARTPEQLEVLRHAGVVDAGARGYLLMLETLDDLIHERRRSGRELLRSVRTSPLLSGHGLTRGRGPAQGTVHSAKRNSGPGAAGSAPGYEVMYLLEADEAAVDRLRPELARLGDSLVVVGGGRLWQVHVHVDDAGAAVEAGLAAGPVRQIRVTWFGDQCVVGGDRQTVGGEGGEGGEGGVAERGGVAGLGGVAGRGGSVVIWAPGAELAELFRECGGEVLDGDPDRRAFVEAVHRTDRQRVVVVPNRAELIGVARAAARTVAAEGITIDIVAAENPVVGLAALAVHDPQRDPCVDIGEMRMAASRVRVGQVRVEPARVEQASVEQLSDGQPVDGQPVDGRLSDGRLSDGRLSDGQALVGVMNHPAAPDAGHGLGQEVMMAGQGLEAEERIVVRGTEFTEVAFGVVAELVSRAPGELGRGTNAEGLAELVTLITGAGVEPAAAEAIKTRVGECYAVEVTIVPGGQSDSLLLIGVE